MQFIFWSSFAAIFYTFFGYPLVLTLIAALRQNPADQSEPSEERPFVTLLISVYNEENVIARKIQNALSLVYPADKLEILVVSDASSDRTDQIVQSYAAHGVHLYRQNIRFGKTYAINKAMCEARGEIVVFSDANSMYDRDALVNMVKHFRNPEVGFVSGYTKYVSMSNDHLAESTGIYTRLETYAKKLESRISSCVGADGAIFAIRKSLFRPLRPYDINDFVIPLEIIAQGYRGVLEKAAYCTEETAKDTQGEFYRQARITCRTIRAIIKRKKLLNPFKYPLFAFQLFSHKIMKFILPFFLSLFFLSNLALLQNGVLYLSVGLVQFFCYLLLVCGYLGRNNERKGRLSGFAFTFGATNCAYLVGWLKYFAGETYTTWSSDRL